MERGFPRPARPVEARRRAEPGPLMLLVRCDGRRRHPPAPVSERAGWRQPGPITVPDLCAQDHSAATRLRRGGGPGSAALPRSYSCRNASMGSMAAARRAGVQVASIAIPRSTAPEEAAPRALRIPISGVRCATEYATTPKIPTEARPGASNPKTPRVPPISPGEAVAMDAIPLVYRFALPDSRNVWCRRDRRRASPGSCLPSGRRCGRA